MLPMTGNHLVHSWKLRTLSGKLIALEANEQPSFRERGVLSRTRLNPARFAADVTQLPLARALAEEVSGVGIQLSVPVILV